MDTIVFKTEEERDKWLAQYPGHRMLYEDRKDDRLICYLEKCQVVFCGNGAGI